MKKLLASLAALLFFAPLAQAAVKVVNKTGKTIHVAIKGHKRHPDNLNARKIKKNRQKTFALGYLKGGETLSGPIRFAFAEDINKPRYYFFESDYEFPIKKGREGHRTFIIKRTDKEYYIDVFDRRKKKELPVILRRGMRKKVPFVVKKTTSRTTPTGTVADW